MIVKMKKITLLCLAEDRDSTLDTLRDLGVLHLVPMKEPHSANLDSARAELVEGQAALNALSAFKEEGGSSNPTDMPDSASELAAAVNKLVADRKQIIDRIDVLRNEEDEVALFGDFDPEQVRSLSTKGIVVKLYRQPGKEPPAPPAGTQMLVLRQDSAGICFAIVAQGDFDFDGNEASLPRRRLSEVLVEIQTAESDLNDIEARLHSFSHAHDLLNRHVHGLEQTVQYVTAQEGMGSDRALAYLGGFCPIDVVEKIQEEAATRGWGLVVEEPAPDDRVPTLVRYPAWVRVMSPVFRFLGITPGYRETDISSAFFVFLSVFFAMIVGDAGYGIFFLILIPYFRKKKFPRAAPEPFRLLYVFSVCTIIWGVLTGNYFGIDYALLPQVLQQLRVDWLMDQGNSMTFSLLLGAIHLTLAHGWKAVRQGLDAGALGQVGWILMVWSVFMLARKLLVSAPLPSCFPYVITTGAVAILVGLVAKKAWMDLGLLLLDLVSCFGDLMSYLRLFALGIASVKVAEAFNGMAGDAAAGAVGLFDGSAMVWAGYGLAAAAMLVILVVGHGLNIILCAMSVLVHGVRLNALEFSLHLGQEWSGFRYNPFRKDLESAA
jgi:V/A-type H+-transporting ATPase subunit I